MISSVTQTVLGKNNSVNGISTRHPVLLTTLADLKSFSVSNYFSELIYPNI